LLVEADYEPPSQLSSLPARGGPVIDRAQREGRGKK
jgi:hypothetical protein